MQDHFIGRQPELTILEDALNSREAEMVAVIGRRRVGKTYLIKTKYEKEIIFEITGLQNANQQQQLDHFNFTVRQYIPSNLPIEQATNWLQAFRILTQVLKNKLSKKKKVIFFDELPWLATNKSGFLMGLEFFWNSWAVKQNVVVVICGSASSWMIEHLVNNTGGLYNRITKRIYMQPFTLSETKLYLDSKGYRFSNYQIAELYMAIGGIPHYLKEIKGNRSTIQNIDLLCFSSNGLLRDEFSLMFSSLFENAEKHRAIIRALATSKQGLTRQKIVSISKVAENGNTTKVLEELQQSGFITSYYPFGKKKKGMLYRLTDEYSLFYLQFIENSAHEGLGTWKHLSQTQAYKTWRGYAFESLCLKHLTQIKKALSIGGVYSQSSSFYKKGTKEEKGTQIDLVLDRNDQVINLFEIKFSNKPFVITKSYAEQLRQKIWTFQAMTKTRKQLTLIFITTFGLTQNQYSLELVMDDLTLDDLFEH